MSNLKYTSASKFKELNKKYGKLSIFDIYNKLNNLEKQNAQMLEALIEIARLSCDFKGTPIDYAWNYCVNAIKSATGQKIEEVIK